MVKTHRLRFWSSMIAMGAIVGSLFVITGCGSSNSSDASSATTEGSAATVKTPVDVVESGKLVFCSEMDYPPEISLTNGQPEGYDYEIGVAAGEQMGLESQFVETPFAAIIGALNAKKCDAIINSVTITPEREKEIAFTPYGEYGLTVLVAEGNPEGIEELTDLCGLAAGATVGTNYIPQLEELSAECKESGEPSIEVVGFQSDPDAVQALAGGKIDAELSDAPVAAYYGEKTGGKVEVAGKPNREPTPFGIAIAKSNSEMQSAMKEAIDNLYKEGTIADIYQKWGVPTLALKQ